LYPVVKMRALALTLWAAVGAAQITYYPFAFDQDGLGGAPDASHLNRTLTAADRLFVRDGRRGLGEGESLEAANIARVGQDETGTAARLDDYLLFLAARDKEYLDTMLAAVRKSAGTLTAVAGTQMGYGGLLNFDSHDSLDYQDNHFYVDYYSFPNVSWDGRDWRIRDQSGAGSGMTSFQTMAIARQAGRPYTVSEYNQPWPNTYAAEIDTTLAVFGAFQDWDSIMHFAYSHGRGWDDGVPNGFNINGDWTKFATLGQAAWLFRSDAIRAGVEPLRIPVSAGQRLRATREKRNGAIGGFLTSVFGFDPNSVFVHRIELVKDGEGEVPEAARQKAATPLATPDIGTVEGGFRLHLQADGAALAPWYEIILE
jgi:hypothetical protein